MWCKQPPIRLIRISLLRHDHFRDTHHTHSTDIPPESNYDLKVRISTNILSSQTPFKNKHTYDIHTDVSRGSTNTYKNNRVYYLFSTTTYYYKIRRNYSHWLVFYCININAHLARWSIQTSLFSFQQVFYTVTNSIHWVIRTPVKKNYFVQHTKCNKLLSHFTIKLIVYNIFKTLQFKYLLA